MTERPRFLFITCQPGAERAVKAELARRWAEFRFAYSRPGFLTFKLPDEHRLMADFDLESVFARSYGFSLAKATGDSPDELAADVWRIYGSRPLRRLHVWQRDGATAGVAGDDAAEPSPTAEVGRAEEALLRLCPRREEITADGDELHSPARPGDFVLDCVIVEPSQWWVGYHRAKLAASLWPGGTPRIELPPEAVSRAWLKTEEALLWSQLPIPPGSRFAEIGSAPGGSSQALLARGLTVLGIDPAEMDPAVTADANFTHLRRKASEVRRRQFRKIRWLAADMNVDPNFTLDTVEQIVTYPEVNVRGMLITLKPLDWNLAEQVPGYLDRVRSWGFNLVRARQLYHNRQEVCVAALKKPFVRKAPPRR